MISYCLAVFYSLTNTNSYNYEIGSNHVPQDLIVSTFLPRVLTHMSSQPREKAVSIVRHKLTEKSDNVSSAGLQLGEYLTVVSASCDVLQDITRLLSSSFETVMKTVFNPSLERMKKTSQETIELLEEKRSICQKLKQEGEQVSR